MVQVPHQLLGLYEIQPINFVVYLFCEDLITATCALLTTQLNYRQDHLSGLSAEFSLTHSLCAMWRLGHRPSVVVVTRIIFCVPSLWFALSCLWGGLTLSWLHSVLMRSKHCFGVAQLRRGRALVEDVVFGRKSGMIHQNSW